MKQLWFVFLMVDDHIRIYMPELNDEYYFLPVTELEYYEYEERTGYDDPPEYLLDDEDVSDTEDGTPSQDKNQLREEILAVWERYKPLLENDYSRSGYILSINAKKYAHANVIVLYIYFNYHVIFLQFIILKGI